MQDQRQLEVAASLVEEPLDLTTGAKEEVEKFRLGGGMVRLLKGAPAYTVNARVQDKLDAVRKQTVPTERFTYKRWVFAVLDEAFDEQGLRDIAASNGLLGVPFVLGTVGGIETLLMYKCAEKDKHRPKEVIVDARVERRCLSKTGNQVQKAVELVQALLDSCAAIFTNLSVETPGGKPDQATQGTPTGDIEAPLGYSRRWTQ